MRRKELSAVNGCRRVFIFFLLCLPGILFPSFSIRAEEREKPKLSWKTIFNDPTFSTRLSSDEMKAKSGTDTDADGLCVMNAGADIMIWTNFNIKNDKFCAYVQRLSVDLSVSFTIFLQKDLVPNSCWHSVVLKHEMTHKNIHTAVFRQYTAVSPPVVLALLDGLEICADNPADAREKINKKATSIINAFIERIRKRSNLENGRFDSEHSYDRQSALCAGKK